LDEWLKVLEELKLPNHIPEEMKLVEPWTAASIILELYSLTEKNGDGALRWCDAIGGEELGAVLVQIFTMKNELRVLGNSLAAILNLVGAHVRP
jgi:hypothetical protein